MNVLKIHIKIVHLYPKELNSLNFNFKEEMKYKNNVKNQVMKYVKIQN